MHRHPAGYVTRINGHLGVTVLSALAATAPRRRGARTADTGLPDRSALYGVLAEIEAPGLDLLEIRKVTSHCESPGSGDSCSPSRPLPSRVFVSLHEERLP